MVDYAKLSARHKEIARRLCSPGAGTADWEEFYGEIREYVRNAYESILEDEVGESVDAFLTGELCEYLQAENCLKLREFINLGGGSGIHHHFFGRWFTAQIHAALNTAPRRDEELVSDRRVTVNKKGEERQQSIIDNTDADDRMVPEAEKDGASLSALLRAGGAVAFSKLISRFWGSNPQETYAVLMDAQLDFRYRKIAVLLGYPNEIAVAGSLRNWRRKLVKLDYHTFITRDRHPKWSFPLKADGREEPDAIGELGKALSAIFFHGYESSPGHFWQLKLQLPFAPDDASLIRGVLTDGRGGVPAGTLFCCGRERPVRADGAFEFPVAEFVSAAKSSEMYFTFADGCRMDGVPFVPDEREDFALTAALYRKWAQRKMSAADPIVLTAELLNDFGFVLPYLLLNDRALGALPFARFGVCYPDRKTLRRDSDEAWVLCRCGLNVDADSPLSPDGFLWPLEWRLNPYGGGIACGQLPETLNRLAFRVLAAFKEEKRQLRPSARFFNDRVSFSDPGLFGPDEEDIASATGALGVALRYAQLRFPSAQWPFVSLKYDFANGLPMAVGGIGQKASVAAAFGGRRLFVAPEQRPEGGDAAGVELVRVGERDFGRIADEVAFDHLRNLKPTEEVRFKDVDAAILAPRRRTVRKIQKLANLGLDKCGTGSFVVLFGKPGMGKSILMGLLAQRLPGLDNHVLGYVCQAGRAHQGLEFVKSMAYALAVQFGVCGEFAEGEELKTLYRKLVVEPLARIAAARKQKKFYLLIDGLDEDLNGEILTLLADRKVKLPPTVAVVVSSRRVVQDEDRLEAVATDVLDLDGTDKECVRDCRMDLRAYIDLWLLSNGEVQRKLIEAEKTSEEMKDAILAHGNSFLYAYFVLNGIAEGRYAIDGLDRDIPVDLKACFYDSFKARFPTAADYEEVKPLLGALVRQGSMTAAAAEKAIRGTGASVGTRVKSLRGYVIETDGKIELSSEPLRVWLADSLHNAEFGV